MKKIIITAAIIVVLLITLSGAFYTVAENEYAYALRFSEIVNVTNEAGLHFKLPFID